MKNRLFILMGIPGSGKSTWCKKNLKPEDLYVSRDEVRFSMVQEDEEYFSKEKEVFKEFCHRIDVGLKLGGDTYADATHLNESSRNKLLNTLTEIPDEINLIYIKVSLETALQRNSLRLGRERVPDDVIKNMYNSIYIDLNNKKISNVTIINND